MLRRTIAAATVLAVLWTISLTVSAAQIKEMPKTSPRPLNSPLVDINSAMENDIVALGLDRAVAKKIVDGRPWRSKHELVTRQVLTADQYEKLKDQLVARHPGISRGKRPKKG